MTAAEKMARPLAEVDPEVAEAIRHEVERQHGQLELIASENFTSEAVLEATGSVFTNKYAEGYPGKRYYGGCEFTDIVENLARERAKKLFGAEYVNVQPHSGSQANQAAYAAVLSHGDTIMGLNLAHGGHLTHGHPLNFSGKTYKVVPYNVRREDERIDYDEVESLAREHRPKMIIAGASAYPRIIDFARFRQIADAVGAIFLVDMAHISGLVAAGVHPNPCQYADIVTSTTHKTLRGPRAGIILAREKYAKDIDKTVFPGVQGGPLVHVVAAKAVCFLEAMQPEFVEYQKQVVANARAMAQALMEAGFRVVSGGTDTHVVLLDVFSKGVRGKEAEQALKLESERLDLALRSAGVAMWNSDLGTGRVSLDERWAKIIGGEQGARVTTAGELMKLVPPGQRDRLMAAAADITSARTSKYRVDHLVRTSSGAWR